VFRPIHNFTKIYKVIHNLHNCSILYTNTGALPNHAKLFKTILKLKRLLQNHHTTLHNLFKPILHDFRKLYRGKNFTHFFTTLHNSIKIYKYFTNLHNTLHNFTHQLYNTLHNFTTLYTSVHIFTTLYTILHNSFNRLQYSTQFYKTLQHFTQLSLLYNTLHIFTNLRTQSLHNSTHFYTAL